MKLIAVTAAAAFAAFAANATAQSGPATITGQALDSQGQPLAGTRIWIRPALTTGLLQTRTDAEGRYRITGALRQIPYRAYAWHTFEYRGKKVCVRLGFTNEGDYDAFVPATDMVRNFRLLHSGSFGDTEDNIIGAEFRLFVENVPPGARVEVNLVPDGPLVDGAEAKPITRTLAVPRDILVRGIPIGAYRVTARAVGAGAAPLEISSTSSMAGFGAEALLEWDNKDSCVGTTATGPERRYLWVRPRS